MNKFLSISSLCLTICNGLWLSEWQEIGNTPSAVTQHFGAANTALNQIYLAGGIVSESSASNTFQTIQLKLDNENNLPFVEWSNETDYHASQMGVDFDLSQFYQHHQSSGFYNNKLYIVEPYYGGDFDTFYFVVCDTASKQCDFITDLDDNESWNYFQPCVTQKDNLLYIVGGINGAQTTDQTLVSVLFYIYVSVILHVNIYVCMYICVYAIYMV